MTRPQTPLSAHDGAGADRGPTPTEAAWIRAHVWTQRMRHTYSGDPGKNNGVPGLYTHCACQYGATTWCQNGRHDLCHRATPLPGCETYIVGRRGNVLEFEQPYEHLATSATGEHQEWAAMVWLADRVCRWVCPCPCGHPQPAAVPVQLDLFAAVA